MMSGMLLAALCYFPIYKEMTSLADWREWERNPENYHTQTIHKETSNVKLNSGKIEVTNKTSYINGCKRIAPLLFQIFMLLDQKIPSFASLVNQVV